MNNSLKIIAVGALSMFVTSTAIAGGAIGVTVASGSIDANGYEKLKSSNNRTTHSASEDVVIGSLFVEHTDDDTGITIGLDFIPYSAEVGSGSNTGDDDIETSGTNKVTVDFKNHLTLYFEKTIGDFGLYVKGGLVQVSVTTSDNLSTGAKYGNKTMSGFIGGVGIKRDMTNDFFVKIAAEYTGYDGAVFKSTESDAVTTVELEDLDIAQARLSIGKRF